MANDHGSRKKRVLIVGAGAAGMSCAHQLAEHPDKFDVTLIDAVDYCGGQAFAIPIDKERFGTGWLNQGVQGGSFIYHHTMNFFSKMGYRADPVELQVSFGKGDKFWNNVYPTKVLARFSKEIKKLSSFIKTIRRLEVVLGLIPIGVLMRLFGFSYEFTATIAFPMIALFLGTGNFTPQVPSMIFERLSTSPTYGMWYPANEHTVVNNKPPMVVFPNLSDFYADWQKSIEKRGVQIRLGTEATRIVSRGKNGVVVQIAKKNNAEGGTLNGETEEHYDEIVLCVLADTAKRLLSDCGSFAEKRILGACKFSDDITVTHWDSDYIKKHYEVDFTEELAVREIDGTDQNERVDWAKENYKPMYLVKLQEEDITKLDLCFDCTNYQGQFPPEVPFENHVFQTIFLNKDRDGWMWSIDEIDEDKIIQKDWWHQLCHSWTHYIRVVPWLWLIQGRRRTRYAASWTMVNAHEVACISGMAAAVNLGAEYPRELERDSFAFLSFRLYYLLQYRSWFPRTLKKGDRGEGSDWGSGVYGSVYKGSGVAKEERSMWKEMQSNDKAPSALLD